MGAGGGQYLLHLPVQAVNLGTGLVLLPLVQERLHFGGSLRKVGGGDGGAHAFERMGGLGGALHITRFQTTLQSPQSLWSVFQKHAQQIAKKIVVAFQPFDSGGKVDGRAGIVAHGAPTQARQGVRWYHSSLGYLLKGAAKQCMLVRMLFPMLRYLVVGALFVGVFCQPAQARSVMGNVGSDVGAPQVGQLLWGFYDPRDPTTDVDALLAGVRPGGVLLFDATGSSGNPQAVREITRRIRSRADALGMPRPLVAVDQEGGPVNRLRQGFTRFPSAMAVGATGAPEYAARMAEAMARQLRAVGVDVALAPVVDVNVNPANPIIGVRAYGSEPDRVAAFGAAAVGGWLRRGTACVAKHFPGHGDVTVDSHDALPVAHSIALEPFRAAVAAGVPAIMSAHVAVPQRGVDGPATLSSRMMTTLLRDELGFSGLVMTDAMTMGAVAGPVRDPQDMAAQVGEACVQAVLAGADVLLFGPNMALERVHPGASFAVQLAAHDALVVAVQSGRISRERLQASVQRIADFRQRFAASPAVGHGETDTPAMRRLAATLSRRSITLVHPGDSSLLPLARGGSVAVLHAGHTAGDAVAHRLKQAMVERGYTLGEEGQAHTVLVLLGREDPVLLERIAALHAAGRRVVVVAHHSPYVLAGVDPNVTQVATYGVVEATVDALADALAGVRPLYGTLPVRLPVVQPPVLPNGGE